MHSKLATSWHRDGKHRFESCSCHHRIRIGIDSCAAVTVLPKSVADDYPMLHTPGKAKSYRPASGERPVVQGGRERTEREEQLQRQTDGDAAQGPVVKAKNAPSAPSLDEWDGHLAAGHAEYRGWCPFCVASKGKSEAHRRMEASRDHVYPELHLDYAYMDREAQVRASPTRMGKFSKDRWLITHLCRAKVLSIHGSLASL